MKCPFWMRMLNLLTPPAPPKPSSFTALLKLKHHSAFSSFFLERLSSEGGAVLNRKGLGDLGGSGPARSSGT